MSRRSHRRCGPVQLIARTSSRNTRGGDRRGFLGQRISISGLGSDAFAEATETIQRISETLSREFASDEYEAWQPGQHGEHVTINASNRYMTLSRDVVDQKIRPFSREVDPRGILQAMTGEDLVHTDDNEVQYYERVSEGETTT